MKSLKTMIALVAICAAESFGQVVSSGDLQTYINNAVNNIIDETGQSNQYITPEAGQISNWETAVSNLLSGNYSAAHTAAQLIDYRIVQYTDNGQNPSKVYYILENDNGSLNYWGTFILNPVPDRSKLFIQSPHPSYEFNTGKQGFYVFRESGARAFYFSGIHRCNNDTLSVCDGTTTVCAGSSEAFRISDQAHTITGTLYKTTEVLNNNISDMIAIQLHGFTKGGSDPDLILSNGIQSDTPPTDYLSQLKDNLLNEDSTLTFEIAHLNLAWDRLIAATNTEGRLINGSIDPCGASSTVNSGRFIHIEQAKAKLRETESDWTKMANAVSATFAVDNLPVELISFSGKLEAGEIILSWQTATEINNYGFEIERAKSPNFENRKTISFIQGSGNSNSPKIYFFSEKTDNLEAGKYYYRLNQIDIDGSNKYSNIIEVDVNENPAKFELSQNYPNPFNPSTIIKYSLAENSNVVLRIYNSLGQLVAELVNNYMPAGIHSAEFNASGFTSGVYFYELQAGEIIKYKKMIISK